MSEFFRIFSDEIFTEKFNVAVLSTVEISGVVTDRHVGDKQRPFENYSQAHWWRRRSGQVLIEFCGEAAWWELMLWHGEVSVNNGDEGRVFSPRQRGELTELDVFEKLGLDIFIETYVE